MRVFAVILALAVISGSRARSVLQDDWQGTWEVTVERFNDYITELNSRADGVVKDIKSSQISRELDTLIQDSMSELALYRDDMQTKLAPYTHEAAERFGKDLQLLVDRLRGHMTDARGQMENYLQEFQTMMEQNADDVKARVSTYTRKLKKRLQKDTQDIQRHVSDYIEELQSRASDNMESMKTRLDPYFTQVRDNAEAKITTLNELLKTQVDNVRDQVQTAGEDLRAALGAKMEELRNWFEPFVTMIRESM
ncbi:apolipoprotein Ea [Xiphophorus couchianus]|uniref:apolipoprotein Ea n=1 Tax=Xiphophorus couchianus TaxID=32473 RepID=UPI001015D210|nr:apolipoprotein Eb-like [Xiphophorus couchianus]